MDKIPNNVVQAGQDIAEYLIDASCRYSMAGLGGCKEFKIDDFPTKYHDLIMAYIEKEILSVTAIFIAMNREMVNSKKIAEVDNG